MSDFHDPGLDAIVRTDRFVDALASGARMSSVDPLSAMLGNWRDDVRRPPDAHVVTLEQASAALAQAQKPHRRNRFTLTVVGAAAAAVLSLGGFVAVVSDARPGDALYGLRTMLFGESTLTRNDSVSLASQQLAEVQTLVQQGQWEQAQQRLVALAPTVQGLDNDPSKQQLVEQYNSLTAKVIQRDPEATAPPPGEPPPVNQSSPLTFLPVPVITEITSPSSIPDLATTTGPTTSLPTLTTSVPTPTSSLPSSTVPGSTPGSTTSLPTPTTLVPTPTVTRPTVTPTAPATVTVTTPPVQAPPSSPTVEAPPTVAKTTVASPPPQTQQQQQQQRQDQEQPQSEQPKPQQPKPQQTKPETTRAPAQRTVVTTPEQAPEGPGH